MAVPVPSPPRSGDHLEGHGRRVPWSAFVALVLATAACSGGGSDGGGAVSEDPIVFTGDFVLNCNEEQAPGCLGLSAAKGTVIEFPSPGVSLTYVDSGVSVEPLDQASLDTALRFQATFRVENNSGQTLDWYQVRETFYLTFDTDTGTEDPQYDVPDLLADGESLDLVATYGVRTNSVIGPSQWEIAVRNAGSPTIIALHADDRTLKGFKAGDITEAEDAAVPVTRVVAPSVASTMTTASTTTTTSPPTTTTSAPATSAPMTSTTSGSASTPAASSAPGERVSVFVEELVGLYSQDAAAEMVASLHPVHQDFWTVDECIATTQSWIARGDWGVERVSGIAFVGSDRINVGGGHTLDTDETYLVTYQQPDVGERQMRVSLEPGGPYWFSNCDPSSS